LHPERKGPSDLLVIENINVVIDNGYKFDPMIDISARRADLPSPGGDDPERQSVRKATRALTSAYGSRSVFLPLRGHFSLEPPREEHT